MSEPASRTDSAMAMRDQFIPVRKSEIIASLVEENLLKAQADEARQFCHVLGSVYHFENFAELERLRDDYYYFNPELKAEVQLPPELLADKRRDLAQALDTVLEKANYKELSHREVEDAHNKRHLLRVQVRAPLDDYHLVQFYERGRHIEKIDV